MYVQLGVKDFTHQLASGNPTPGGGSAAALAGAMGAALVAMYCNLTVGRKKYALVKDEMEEIAAVAWAGQEQLLGLVDRDSAAYQKIVAANRLPRQTEAEKVQRSEAIDAATLEATRTPLETATAATKLLERAVSLASKGNPNALSDLQVGVQLLFSAFIGARANVEINLSWLKEEAAKELEEEIVALAHRAEGAMARVREEITALLA